MIGEILERLVEKFTILMTGLCINNLRQWLGRFQITKRRIVCEARSYPRHYLHEASLLLAWPEVSISWLGYGVRNETLPLIAFVSRTTYIVVAIDGYGARLRQYQVPRVSLNVFTVTIIIIIIIIHTRYEFSVWIFQYFVAKVVEILCWIFVCL